MKKYFQNWFSKRKSEDPQRPDSPETSTQRLPIVDLELGLDRGPEPQAREREEGVRLTNVIQSTVVAERHSVIPPVTQLILGDTADRITRAMEKLDSLFVESPEPKRKHH